MSLLKMVLFFRSGYEEENIYAKVCMHHYLSTAFYQTPSPFTVDIIVIINQSP